MVHLRGLAARSALMKRSSGPPAAQVPAGRKSHSLLSAMTCHWPMLNEYQPWPAVPPLLPKYWKYPPALRVPYSWLPGTAHIFALKRPHDGLNPAWYWLSEPVLYWLSPSARTAVAESSSDAVRPWAQCVASPLPPRKNGSAGSQAMSPAAMTTGSAARAAGAAANV